VPFFCFHLVELGLIDAILLLSFSRLRHNSCHFDARAIESNPIISLKPKSVTIMSEEEVTIDPALIIFPDTYITDISRYSFQITNHRTETLCYRWCRFGSIEEEHKATKHLDVYDANSRLEFSRVLDYNSEQFFIEQISGEIWPNRSRYFIFNFRPNLAQLFTDSVYFSDVDTNRRYRVELRGRGLPPDARFDPNTITVGHVHLIVFWNITLRFEMKGKFRLITRWRLPLETG
jgi:hypothetical protein